MNAESFVARWSKSELREQQGAQSHFNELCALVGQPAPTEADPAGSFFTFEKQVIKADGKPGRADVWYQGRFAWEYKSKDKDLDAAYQQLLSYKSALENPPLLVVCDFDEYRIYPQWTNMNAAPFIFHNADLLQTQARNYIRWVLSNPDEFIEERKRQQSERTRITEKIARDFGSLTEYLNRERAAGRIDWSSMRVARFLTKLVFALFVEDIGLLPKLEGKPILRYLLDAARLHPAGFATNLEDIFKAMNGERRDFAMKRVAFFNGRLFADAEKAGDGTEVLDLTAEALMTDILENAANADWRKVDPTIFGTLFEAALDESKRAQLGAHYTSEQDIRLIVEPVLMAPLQREWDAIRAQAEPHLQRYTAADTPPNQKAAARNTLIAFHNQFMTRLGAVRVLDPACGSGNFLYVSLKALKDLESHVQGYFAALKLPFMDVVTPRQLYGIEKDPFAAKLAHVVVWIGYLQWRYESAGELRPVEHEPTNPNQIKEPIVNDSDDGGVSRILNDDAILRYDADGKPYEPEWPPAEVIMSNPPFLGARKLRAELDPAYLRDLYQLYAGRISDSDLVCYWFDKGLKALESKRDTRIGLLAANSIRGGANRKVLDRIEANANIFWAESDRPWLLAGAAVRVSMVAFDGNRETHIILNSIPVDHINPDLTAQVDLTQAKKLPENRNLCFQGTAKTGAFDITDKQAEAMLTAVNRSGLPNSDVVKPWLNAMDVTRRSRNMWVIDFDGKPLEEAQAYEVPFNYAEAHVKSTRTGNNQKTRRERWWQHGVNATNMRIALEPFSRFIATPTVAKHRVFIWLDSHMIPDHQLYAIAREDDYFFGVLHSYLHECWSLRMGTSLEDRPRYTPTTTFETFPFPWPPGKEPIDNPRVIAIGAAAKILDTERLAWLNPPDLSGLALKKRTLINLYNALEEYRAARQKGDPYPTSEERPATLFASRLAELHAALDSAVLAAYGWPDLADRLRTEAGDADLLRRLLALNADRAGG